MNREEIGKLADIVIQNLRISEALAKQRPMKPLTIYSEYTCPMCEITISKSDEYCWHCGQKLDWGE